MENTVKELFANFRSWWKRTFWRHHWEYPRPYRRLCKTCKRYEVSHCASLESWNHSWWEVFDEGDVRLHTGEA